MTSFLIAAQDKAKRLVYSKDFCKKQGIDPVDITLIEKEEDSKNTQSIGINDVKLMQKKIFFKPIKSKTKAVIIEDAHLLTTEAQNALLKVLEEPPAHTIIVLGAQSKESLLPTIISRCQVITLTPDALKLTPKKEEAYREFITNFPTMSIGEKLKKAELLAKDKEKALIWLGQAITVMHEDLIKDPSNQDTITTLKKLQGLYTLLKTTNVNLRFAIEAALLA